MMKLHYIKSFWRSKKAIATIELAFFLPVFLVLLVGSIETIRYVIFLQKVEQTVDVVADYVTQQDEVCINNIIRMAGIARTPLLNYVAESGSSNNKNISILISSIIRSDSTFVPRTCVGGSPQFCSAWDILEGPNLAFKQVPLDGELPGGMTMAADDNYILVQINAEYEPALDITGSFVASFGGNKRSGGYAILRPRNGDLRTQATTPECGVAVSL